MRAATGATVATLVAMGDGSHLHVRCICKRLLGLRLQNRCSVAKPDPATPHGQSSRGAAEGEGRFPTAITTLRSPLDRKFPEAFNEWQNTSEIQELHDPRESASHPSLLLAGRNQVVKCKMGDFDDSRPSGDLRGALCSPDRCADAHCWKGDLVMTRRPRLCLAELGE